MLRCDEFKVVIIDDNVDAAEMFAALLESFGYRVKASFSAKDGLTLCVDFEPHVVFCDIGMPAMDGYAFARTLSLQNSFPRPLLVAVTGWGDAGTREKTRNAGYRHHMVKPARIADLLAILENQRGTL